ncbi:hypothetical protein FRC17_008141, partial [Serendipita sp. 399]
MVGVVHGMQGIQSTLRDILTAFRQGGVYGSPMHHAASPETHRASVHSPVDTRSRNASYQAPVPSSTPPSASSYENQFSPAAANHPHGPYASSNAPQPHQPPTASASTQPSHPTFHPGFPNLPPISPATTSVMAPPRFPTSLPPLRSHISEYQSNVRNSQPSPNPYSMQRPGSGRAHHNNSNVNSSNVTSADNSDDEGSGELPGAGLVAPLEVLRDLGEQHELNAND